MSKQRFPLEWPMGFERSRFGKKSAFGDRTLTQVVSMLLSELLRMRAGDVIISSNVPLRGDGLPRADYKRSQVSDKGVAVYFTYNKVASVLCCDKWDCVEDNMYAIVKSVEAMRGLERWGVSDILQRAFTGFKAIEERAGVADCWEVLGIECVRDVGAINRAYKRKVMVMHPDVGGDEEQFIRLQQAYDEAKRYAGGGHG